MRGLGGKRAMYNGMEGTLLTQPMVQPTTHPSSLQPPQPSCLVEIHGIPDKVLSVSTSSCDVCGRWRALSKSLSNLVSDPRLADVQPGSSPLRVELLGALEEAIRGGGCKGIAGEERWDDIVTAVTKRWEPRICKRFWQGLVTESVESCTKVEAEKGIDKEKEVKAWANAVNAIVKVSKHRNEDVVLDDTPNTASTHSRARHHNRKTNTFATQKQRKLMILTTTPPNPSTPMLQSDAPPSLPTSSLFYLPPLHAITSSGTTTLLFQSSLVIDSTRRKQQTRRTGPLRRATTLDCVMPSGR